MIRNKGWPACAGALLMALLLSSQTRAQTSGAELYQRCAACHMPTAEGVTGMFPPLKGRLGALTQARAGRDYLVTVVEAGLSGSIEVDGVSYQGIMPAQGPGLGDEGVATVLNYVLDTFNTETIAKDRQPFTRAEVGEVKTRYPQATGQTTHDLRSAAFTASAATEQRTEYPRLTAASSASARSWAGVVDPERARYHWVMQCQGCHGVEAEGTAKGAPRMAGTVGQFLHSEEGRAFLGRVPGVAFVSLSDGDVAELLNWVVQIFDPTHVPNPFRPYGEAEIKALRQQPLISRAFETRSRILSDLNAVR